MMKVLKHKNIMGLIYGLFLLFPLLSVLSRCVYAGFNKNAFESMTTGYTLDNVFEYSIGQFVADNNFGKFDFFGFLSNFFLDNTNAVNNLYVNFINWYMNYVLYVSTIYVMFAVIMWFINYVRRLLEKGQDWGQGGY